MIDPLLFYSSGMPRTTVLPYCCAGLLLFLLLTGCDNCEDCQPTTTYVYSVANLTDQPVTMIFYPSTAFLAAGKERVEIAPETTVRLHEASTYQSSGPVSLVPAESSGQRGSYDSLAIVLPTERFVLSYADCADTRNALCIENYEKSERDHLIAYTLLVDE